MTEARGLPVDLKANPRLSGWLRFEPEGTVCVSTGKVELGQGISTAYAQIAADALKVDLARVRIDAVSTAHSPNQGPTAGSFSVEMGGAALRQACLETRAVVTRAVAERLEADPRDLELMDGEFWLAGTVRASYWSADTKALLERDACGDVPDDDSDKAARFVGRSAARLDLPGKLRGRPCYLHDLTRSGILHARVVHPPSIGAELLRTGETELAGLSGIRKVVREGDFLGVIAEREEVAVAAAARLARASVWRAEDLLAGCAPLEVFLRGGRQSLKTIAADSALPGGGQRLRAKYTRPFIAHASIAPSCAIASWRDGPGGPRINAVCHSQGIFSLRRALAKYFELSEDAVIVDYAESAGCYGHNGHDDVAFEAVLFARAVPGTTVRLQWSRADELAWAPFGAAGSVELEAELDAGGNVVHWRHDTWGTTHAARLSIVGPAAFLGGRLREGLRMPPVWDDPVGIMRNCKPEYAFPRTAIASHCREDSPIRSSSLRSLGAHCNVFASESFMDELALAACIDPLEYRLRHLQDPRGRAVLVAAADAAEWPAPIAVAGRGRGLAYSRYKNTGGWCAAVAEIDVSGRDLRVIALTLAVDVGLVVNPDGVRNQVEGGAVQATSWALKEEVTFDAQRITSDGWERYPILRFSEVPRINVVVLDRPGEPSVGAGELAQGPVAAAIANALHAAAGARVRDLPLTRERIAAAL